MEIKVKDKTIKLNFEYIDTCPPAYYSITALSNKNETMGYLTFSVKKDYIWIYKIKVEEKFQHKGVGTGLMSALEYFAYTKGIRKIEGKYMPENKYAEPMYNKLGYYVDKEDYNWEVFKILNLEAIKAQIAPKIKNFKVKNAQKDVENAIDCRL